MLNLRNFDFLSKLVKQNSSVWRCRGGVRISTKLFYIFCNFFWAKAEMSSLIKPDCNFLPIPLPVMLPKPGCDPLTRQKVLDDIEKIEDYQVRQF